MIRYGTERRENRRYAAHTDFLSRHSVPVPNVIDHLPRKRVLLVEDAGDVCLNEAVRGAEAGRVERLYRKVLRCVGRMHAIGPDELKRAGITLEPPFSPALYRWEHELAAEHFFGPLAGLPDRRIDALLRDLSAVADLLDEASPVLLHRDLQSENILLKRGNPVLVDYQGMRFGPAAYDLAALLCDPYVMLPGKLQLRLLQGYARREADGAKAAAFFWPAAVQRLTQALGAYGRLSRQPGMSSYADHIDPALLMLKRALRRLPGLESLKEFVRQAARKDGRRGSDWTCTGGLQ